MNVKHKVGDLLVSRNPRIREVYQVVRSGPKSVDIEAINSGGKRIRRVPHQNLLALEKQTS